MKPVAIVSYGTVQDDALARIDLLPEFRKATLNMKLAYVALEMALDPIKDKKDRWQKSMALFLGSGHGEFNATLEFLKAWGENKHARPFVFQNSLHNSTTGFLGLLEGIHMPSVTVSHHHFSGEDSLDMAQQFILTGACEIAAVVGVDARTIDHLPIMKDAGFPDGRWGQGAGAMVLASEKYCKENELKILGLLKGIDVVPELKNAVQFVQDDFVLEKFYDSKAIEDLAARVALKNDEPLVINKPNGGVSTITWSNYV